MSKKKKKKNFNQKNEQVNNKKPQKEQNIDNEVKKPIEEAKIIEEKPVQKDFKEEKPSKNDLKEEEKIPKMVLKSEEVSQKSFEELKQEAIEKENKLRKIKDEPKKADDITEEKTIKKVDKEKNDEPKEKEKQKSEPEEKSLVKPKDNQLDYIKDSRKKDKKIGKFLFVLIILLLICLGFSTGFAIFNLGNTNILSKITIKDIDVSKLSQNEARNTLNETLQGQLNFNIKLKNGDYLIEIKPEDIEFKYDINDAILNAYNFARQGNIIENNYQIIKALILGEEIKIEYKYNEDELAKIIDDIAVNIPGVVQNPGYYIEGDGIYIDKGKDGIEVKKAELKQLIINTIYERNSTNYEDKVLNIPVENKKADKINIEKIAAEIKCEPKDAYYETEPDFKIYKEQNGIDLAVSFEDANNFVSNDLNGVVGEDGILTFRLPLLITPASKTINDIGLEAFPYEIATFTTRYDATNYSRTNNLEIATDKINGTVLMPGEEFSFNQVVGKRTVEEGYKDAKIYENGRVVDGLAGGICQVSSTLYNAALLSNLDIVERNNHSFVTSYLPAGRDATVVYGVKDLRFVNSRSYPIKIQGEMEAGIIRFTIYGIKEEEEMEIRIYANVVDTIPMQTQTKIDNSLAPGQVVYEQKGHSGCRSVTTMKKYLDGELVFNEVISSDTYNQMTTIKRVGPGGDDE